jgi:hypothetical protein
MRFLGPGKHAQALTKPLSDFVGDLPDMVLVGATADVVAGIAFRRSFNRCFEVVAVFGDFRAQAALMLEKTDRMEHLTLLPAAGRLVKGPLGGDRDEPLEMNIEAVA